MRIKRLFLLVYLMSLFCCKFSYAERAYQEKITPQGKVIFGLRGEEALNKYGVPASIKGNLWYYGDSEKLYIYLEEPLEVYLYPRFIKGYVDSPLELRTLAGSQEITDVTSKSELLLSKAEGFNIVGQGVLVPKKPGDYQIIAMYKGRYSNASFISVAEAKKEVVAEEQLISIDIFPYKPYANPNATVYFYAFGTFVFKGRYTVREITMQAEWFSEQYDQILKLKDSKVALLPPGKSKIFCKYKGLQGIPQDVEVAKSPVRLNRSLKQVSIIPTDVAAAIQTSIPFHAFATYEDNSVEEVTKRIGWVIKDKAILERESDNIFVAKLVGVTELQGVLGNLRSLPVKVVVSSSPVNKGKAEKIKKQKINLDDLFEDIKGDIKDLNIKVAEENKFKYIKIVPDHCDISVGAQKQFSAFGVRQDNTEEDITILGKWKVLDHKFTTVKSGLVNAISLGEIKVCVQYKNIENQCIPVIVREAKLISIAVSPPQLKIAKGEHMGLKAEGYFGDSSHRDITLLVGWVCSDLNIAKMDKNNVWPIRVGQTKIFAEYLGIRSLPVEMEVVQEKYWLLKLIAKILCLIFLAGFLLYSYFYILTEKSKGYILSLYSSPRDLTIALYKNLNKIISIFGIQQKFYMPPLFLAGLADEKYAINDNLFLRFTQRYEEAKYSSHIFPPEASHSILEAYNQILKIVFAQHKKRTLACRYLKALISKTPFFICKIQPS
ncbi:MAG: hypothetical protein KJ710_00940 [Candidatus Omnitrophica bacterium]|nr:hypothetical protein [Candidatus Omnitrophota bacterium]MBU1922817.1 hypothetical protein [Candidatus Omnitrophota bacterium]